MSYPSNYNAIPVAPKITIKDHNFKDKYKWQHAQFPNYTQDFDLKSWEIKGGVNGNHSRANLKIRDQNHKLYDDIRAGDLLLIELGKEDTQSWFYGILDEPEIIRDGYNQLTFNLKAINYGIRLASKHVTVDFADYKISDIVKETIGTDFATDIQDINITLKNYQKTDVSQARIINEMANITDCIYYVDGDLTFHFFSSKLKSKEVITNNLEEDLPAENLLFIRNKSYGYQDSLVRGGHTTLIGQGVNLVETLQSATSDDDNKQAYTNLTGWNYLAFELPKLRYPFLEARINGTPNAPMKWWIYKWRETSFDFLPGNSGATLHRQGIIKKEDMQKIQVENNNVGYRLFWLKIPAQIPEPESGYVYYLVWDIQNTVYRGWGIHNKATNPRRGGSLNKLTTNTHGVGNTSFIDYDIIVRAKRDQKVRVLAQNTTYEHQTLTKELIQNLRDETLSTENIHLITGLLDLAAKSRRTYTNLTTSAPQNRLTLGKRIRIKDDWLDLNRQALLIGYGIKADESTNLNTVNISLELEERV